MLEIHERPVFLAACAGNLAFAITGALAIEIQAPVAGAIAVFGGAAAFLVGVALGVRILTHDGGMHRKWIKAGLVFLILGPLGFWGLLWPAMVDTICIAGHRCYSEAAIAFHARAIGDVIQSQFAMIAVALAALVCAARAMSVTLDELAL
jgi:hypothetical protein